MRHNAYQEWSANALRAFKAGDYPSAAQEGCLALEHASNDQQAAPLHKLLSLACGRLGQTAAAAEHRQWLLDHPAVSS